MVHEHILSTTPTTTFKAVTRDPKGLRHILLHCLEEEQARSSLMWQPAGESLTALTAWLSG